MFRGIRQNGTGVAIWPFFDLGIGAFERRRRAEERRHQRGHVEQRPQLREPAAADSGTNPTCMRPWASGSAAASAWRRPTRRTRVPNDSFTHVKEIAVKLSVDDSAALGIGGAKAVWARGVRTGDEPGRYQADGGLKAAATSSSASRRASAARRASLAIPVKVGLSVGDYYELGRRGQQVRVLQRRRHGHRAGRVAFQRPWRSRVPGARRHHQGAERGDGSQVDRVLRDRSFRIRRGAPGGRGMPSRSGEAGSMSLLAQAFRILGPGGPRSRAHGLAAPGRRIRLPSS